MENNLALTYMNNQLKNAKVIEDVIVPPGGYWGGQVPKGHYLRIVDLEGQQAVDFLCYDAHNPENRYNAANTIKINGNVFLGKGSILWSEAADHLAIITDDTCESHDTIYGCCSREVNQVRYGERAHACRENFLIALKNFNLGAKDIVSNVNFFMNVPIGPKGELTIAEGLSKPGDYVELCAERDLITVLSNCPQKFNLTAGFNPSPVRVVVYALNK